MAMQSTLPVEAVSDAIIAPAPSFPSEADIAALDEGNEIAIDPESEVIATILAEATDAETNADRVASAIAAGMGEIASISRRVQEIEWIRKNILPILPAGVEISKSFYSYSVSSLELAIPDVPSREWRGLDGPAGLVYKTRKALGITKFTRSVTTYGGAPNNVYRGTAFFEQKNGERKTMWVTLQLGDQMPPTCKLEEVEEEVPASTRKVLKVVCA